MNIQKKASFKSGPLSPLDATETVFVLSFRVIHVNSTKLIFIQVSDANDNAPVFTEVAYSFDIPEDATRGSVVGIVTANDADEGINGQVSYTVLSDWGNDIFSLNPQTGIFTLTSRLDYEQVMFLHFYFLSDPLPSNSDG